MSTSTGISSELYFIDPRDILSLKDYSGDVPQLSAQEVSILIRPDCDDVLYSGRKTVKQAIKDKKEYIPVRIIFACQIPWWHLLAIFIKPLRRKYKYKNSQFYHSSLSKLRELKIERGIRNAENAYKISKRWHISEEARIAKYQALTQSLEKGYNDNYPIKIMPCRRYGIKDCIDDGHHRIGICVDKGIDRITISFCAAGALPHWVQKLILPLL